MNIILSKKFLNKSNETALKFVIFFINKGYKAKFINKK